jgi:signal transduction histidine kinase
MLARVQEQLSHWKTTLIQSVEQSALSVSVAGHDVLPRRSASGAALMDVELLLIRVRFAACLAAGAALAFLSPPNTSAMGVVILSYALNVILIWRILIPRFPRLLQGGYLLLAVDHFFLALATSLTGGLDSPFSMVFFATVATHALRFPGIVPIFFAPIASIVALFATTMLFGRGVADLPRLIFLGFWLLILGLTLALTVERGRIAENALADELRRTRALYQAAHAPAASLSVQGVLDSVAEQACRLTESDVGVVLLYDKDGSTWAESSRHPISAASEELLHLVECQQFARALLAVRAPVERAWVEANAPNGIHALARFTSLIGMEIRDREQPSGVVAVAQPEAAYDQGVHYDALSAFVQRAALAIQNARLYERLQEQVDELQDMHQQIVRTERLAAIGEIAAKVAHELNNPLTSIHLYNSMLLEEPVEGEEQQRLAASMLEQVERAKRVVRDILDFSRPQESHPEITSLNAAVEYGLRLIQHAAGSTDVVITEDYARGLPDVLIDTGQMAQVFTNLAMNALQAMPEGGKLSVRTGKQDEELYVSFTDTGMGISATDQERIFEPFFTTKAAGQGTGLGLSVVNGLVNRHHGRITVDSEPGKGSTFTVWLPPATMQIDKEGLVARPQRR